MNRLILTTALSLIVSPVMAAYVSAPTPSGSTNHQAGLVVDRAMQLPNGGVIEKLGLYSSGSRTYKVKVVRRNSTGNYDVDHTVTITHAGGGWQDVDTSYTVPASGDYFLSYWYESSGSIAYNSGRTRAWKFPSPVAEPTGNLTGATEDSGNTGAMRYFLHEETTTPPPASGTITEIGCILRPNTSGTWSILDDADHTPEGCASVAQFSDRIEITFSNSFTELMGQGFDIKEDEVLTDADVRASASCGLNKIIVYFKQIGIGGWKNPASITNSSANINIRVRGR